MQQQYRSNWKDLKKFTHKICIKAVRYMEVVKIKILNGNGFIQIRGFHIVVLSFGIYSFKYSDMTVFHSTDTIITVNDRLLS